MKISIITACRNSADTIEDTIRSVASQDYQNIEYIIIDGASTDETVTKIKYFGDKISLLISEVDHGLYDALNKGIERASGEIIGILNSDDFYSNNQVISKIANKFTTDSCDALYSDLDYVERKNTSLITRKWIAGKYKEGLFDKGWMPPHPGFFVKKKIYDRFGKFNTSFKYSADYEIMLRLIHKHKISLSYLPETTVKMRMGGYGNKSMFVKLLANLEDRKAWKINSLKPSMLTLWRKPFSKLMQFVR